MTAAEPRRHRKPFSPLRSWAEYQLIAFTLAGLRKMSLERASAFMARLVEVGGMAAPRWKRVGLDNLRHAFPEHDDDWREKILRGSFRSLGRLAAEVAWFEELRPGNVHERVGFVSPESEALWKERMAGSGAIIATGHFGNWELFGQAQGLMGYPVHVIHRALRNPRLDDLLIQLRARAGTNVIYKHAAAREILRLLKGGALVVIPIDQHAPGAQGVPIPFFGRPAATTPGPARLAQLTRVPLQLAVLVRRGESTRHDILMCPPIEPPRPGRDPAILVETMTRVNREFEAIVRRYPEQWLWVHRRWRKI